MSNIVIKSCKECPNFTTTNHWTSDGWDKMDDWMCTKENKKIQGAVEWFEESKIQIPEWCPLINIDNKKDLLIDFARYVETEWNCPEIPLDVIDEYLKESL